MNNTFYILISLSFLLPTLQSPPDVRSAEVVIDQLEAAIDSTSGLAIGGQIEQRLAQTITVGRDGDLIKPALEKFIAGLPDGFNGIAPAALKDQLAATKPFLLDVREAQELINNGFIEGAVNIPIRTLLKNLDKLPGKHQPIVVYCAIGHRGAIALEALQLLGYTNVKSLLGGYNAWRAASLAVATGTPVAPTAGKAPDVEKNMLAALDKYLSGLPDGFSLIAPAALNEQIATAKPFLLDVREEKEVTDNGKLADSVNVPIRSLLKNLGKLPGKDKPIVVYCAVGHRGGLALAALQLLGYTNVKSLSGGFNAWNAGNFPLVK